MRNIQRPLLFLFVILMLGCLSAQSAKVSGPNFCQGCRSVVSFMTKINQTEPRSQVIELFRDFCETYYPPSTDFQGPCTWFANGLFFVIDRTDPVYHCDQIGACGKSNFDRSQQNSISRSKNSQLDDGFCTVCQQLVNEAKAVLEDPSSIDLAHKQLDALCDYLSLVGLSSECKQQVNKYLNEGVEFINELDPLNYCQSIQLCQHQRRNPAPVKPLLGREQQQEKLQPALADFNKFGIETSVSIGHQTADASISSPKTLKGPGCTLCKTVVKELFHFLKENKTEENIRDGLEKICGLIYSDKDKISECDDMVAAYTRELIEFLAAESDPNLICILIDQCTYHKISKMDDLERNSNSLMSIGQFMTKLDPNLESKSFETCLECKVFIRYLRDQIDKPLTEAKIKAFLLEKLCVNLGDKDLQESCKRLINQYADIFFKAVVMELDPESACVAMEACRNKTQEPTEESLSMIKQLISEMTTQPSDDQSEAYQCQSCTNLVDIIDSFIATYPGTPSSETMITELCPRVADQQLCETMINSAGSSFVHHLTNLKEPREVCLEAKYC